MEYDFEDVQKKVKIVQKWREPRGDLVKFNVDGATRDKLGSIGVGSFLHDSQGVVLAFFSETVRKRDSIEAKLSQSRKH